MNEIALRKEAVSRYLSGETQVRISRSLGKSRFWVSSWIARYDPADPEGSLQNRSSAPKQPHRTWSESLRQQVLNSRRLRLAAEQPGYQYALIGAEAIHYELQALGIQPVPPVRTIHSWIKQSDLIPDEHEDPDAERPPKPYPLPEHAAVNDLHQLDLKGPFYLTGGPQKHYLLALRDYVSKGVALQASRNKQAQTMADFLVAGWQRRGLPKVLQMDNGLEFRGSNRYPRSFGKVVRLCLDLEVEPLFIPPHEPWRNGFIENFNGLADRLLLKRKQFESAAQLAIGVQSLEQAINTSHRLPALAGQTPDEFSAAQTLRRLPADYDGHKRDLQLVKGRISFIRLVRKSGRITLCANDKFEIGTELQWQYVLAQVEVSAEQLNIYHEGRLIKTFDYRLGA